MPVKVRGGTDECLDAVTAALERYQADHPRAEIEAYRRGDVSIHIRVIDPDFAGVGRADRHDAVWAVLEGLPEDVLYHVSVILPITPQERAKSFASVEFDNPTPID